MLPPQTHIHPVSGQPFYGSRLEMGDEALEGDFYDSSSGKWSEWPCIGMGLLQGSICMVIRPTLQKIESSYD